MIAEVRSAEFWQNISVERLEHARKELRGIMKYRQRSKVLGDGTPATGTKDGGVEDFERPVYLSGDAEALQYRRRLKDILDAMLKDNPVLQKVYSDEPYQLDDLKTLTSTILTSNPGVNLDVLNQFYDRTADQLHITIRELVGMDPEAVENHFTDFLHNHPTLTAQQVRFMNLLKNHIAQHGTISIEKLYEPPFDSVSHEGVDGVFNPEDVDALVNVLKPFLAQETKDEPVN